MASSISSRLTRDELGSLFRVIGDLREESEVSRLGGLYIATADSLYGRFLEEEPSTPAPTPIQIEGTLTSEDYDSLRRLVRLLFGEATRSTRLNPLYERVAESLHERFLRFAEEA